jgi:hypothetical protein
MLAGSGFVFDASTSKSIVGISQVVENTAYITMWYSNAVPFGTDTGVGSGTVSGGWASGDMIAGGFTYELA